MSRSLFFLLSLLGLAGLWLVPSQAQDRPAGQPQPRARWVVSQERVLRALAYSKDGKHIAAGGNDHQVRLYEAATGRVLRTFSGHTDRVYGVAFSPDGKLLASAGGDKSVRIWNVETGAAVRVLPGHTDRVRSVAFSPDGRVLASTSEDKTARLWDAVTGRELRTLPGHEGGVWSVAWAPKGDRLATSGTEGTVRLWNPATGAALKVLTGHSNEVWSVAFSPDGRTLASAGLDQLLKVWDVATGSVRRTFAEGGPVVSVAYSPDNSTLAAASYSVEAFKLGGGFVRVRSARLGHTFTTLTGPKGPVMTVAFSPGGESLAATSGYESAEEKRPGELTVWNVEGVSAEVLRQDQTPRLAVQSGHRGDVAAVAYSPDGLYLASAEARLPGSIKIWDPRTGTLLRTLSGHQIAVHSLQFSPDSRLLASGNASGSVMIWDPRTGDVVTQFPRGNAVHAVAFSPDGRWLASTGADGAALVREVATGKSVLEIPGSAPRWTVAFSPDGTRLVVGAQDGAVEVWDMQARKSLRTFKAHAERVSRVAFSRDGRLLATTGHDKLVKLWDAATGALVRTLYGHPQEVAGVAFSPDGGRLATVSGALSAQLQGELRLWDLGAGALIQAVPTGTAFASDTGFSPDGAAVAVATGSVFSGDVRVFDGRTGELRHKLSGPSQTFQAVRLTPDGRAAVTGSGTVSYGELQVWDLARGELRQTLSGHEGQVSSLNFTRDGRLLASGAWDGTVRIWNTAGEAGSWAPVKTLSGHSGFVTSLAFSGDGALLASAAVLPGQPSDVRLWDVTQGKPVRTFDGHPATVNAVALSPDQQLLATGGADRIVRLWETATGKLLRALPEQVGMIQGLAFAPDGRTLASSAANPGTGVGEIQLWDLAGNAPPRSLSGTLMARSVAFSPDGTTVAGEAINLDEGRMVSELRVWDARSGDLQRTLPAYEVGIADLSFSADGNRLATINDEGTVRLWNPRDGRLHASLVSLPAEAQAVARPLLAGSKPLLAGSKAAGGPSDYLLFTPEGYYSGSAAADRYVRFRLGEDLFPAESFQARYYRPDLVRRALAGESLPQVGLFKGAYPPVVAVSSPKPGTKIGEKLELSLEASDDSGIQRVELFVNGARVDARPIMAGAKPLILGAKPLLAGSKPIPDQHTTSRTVTASLPLPAGAREIRVQAIAYDEDGLQSAREEILFTRDAAAAPTGRLLGLCVGVSRYEDSRLNLKYAHKDAQVLAQQLQTQRGIYSSAETAALVDEKATSAGIRAGLDSLVSRARKQDTVVVFLSGHGWRSDDRTFYFASHEVSRADIPKTALPWTDVVQRLRQLSEKSKRVVVLLDACHSGSAATNEDLVKALLSANAGVIVFASSKGSEVSLESPELEHGVFTKALLEALEGKAAPAGEKGITVLDFLSYVSRRVKALTTDMQHPHIPFLQDFETDATLVTTGG